MKYVLTVDDAGRSTITVITGEGEQVVVNQDHPNFLAISAALHNGQPITHLLKISDVIEEMSDRVSIVNGEITFDGKVIENELANTILRYHREGRDTGGLVKFMERLSNNPSARGRAVIFEWVQGRNLTIDEDGYFLGWKGVNEDLTSVNSGRAFVDDDEHEGHIPNVVGSWVSMPRTEVMDDPNADCHIGLHVGTYEYAKNFGRVLLEVRVDPADVVSVPAHSTSWKIRCCRYQVVKVHENETDDWDVEYEPEASDEYFEDFSPLEEALPQSFADRLREKFFGKR